MENVEWTTEEDDEKLGALYLTNDFKSLYQ